MLKVPILLFLLGSASLWVLAEGASTAQPEDDIVTPGVEHGMVTQGADIVTASISEKFDFTDSTTLVPTSVESVTQNHIEDLSTFQSTVHGQEESQSTTAPDGSSVATGSSVEKWGEQTQTTVEKDGLPTATLVGIIIGVLVAICLVGGIIVVAVRKMSGRYLP
ncbi:PREDICTED: podoplanin-like [Chrysochloris asiatica]|uniref:Podoplanin-like n=1 Tax=Chrysochloris asiatica TaxID=185453 RepID=A0A9B0U0Q1_CHRAS|nr:PREDICTED: podoplanin-like [Chrysochloris asiatica]